MRRALVDGTTPSSCTVPVSFGVVVARSPSAARELGPPVDLNYVDPLNGDPQPDVFTLVLVDGRGAFASGGIAPKTIQLGGVEAAYATCGGCVEIFSDVNAQGNFAAFYLASSGTLTITAVSPRLTGTLSTVTLVHLDDNDVVVDACTTRIDSLAFDVPISP